jgi:pilus assembly protein CpaE
MAIKTEPKTIFLISKNPFIIESTRIALKPLEFLILIDKDMTSLDPLPIIAETQPDVILFDFEFQNHPLDLLEKIVSEYPGFAVIAILPESEMVNSDRVILSGGRAFIQYPYQTNNLIVIIKRVLELTVRKEDFLIRIPDTDVNLKPRNTFTVFSPKGGAGTSTIATNLAISLHKTLKEDVLLIDGKHQFGHVALYLNLHTGNSIIDLLTHGLLDTRLIKQVVIRHISGIDVLPSPNSLIEAQGIRPENLFKLIQSLQQVFPNIIIDAGNNLNENTVTYMDSSDKILLVLNPSLASMRDVRQFMEISNTLSYPKDKSLLILNQTGRKADVRKEEIEKILKMKIFGMIPADENLALSSLNEGVPILIKSPHNPISKAFNNITAELLKIIQTVKTEYLDKEKENSEKTELPKKKSK